MSNNTRFDRFHKSALVTCLAVSETIPQLCSQFCGFLTATQQVSVHVLIQRNVVDALRSKKCKKFVIISDHSSAFNKARIAQPVSIKLCVLDRGLPNLTFVGHVFKAASCKVQDVILCLLVTHVLNSLTYIDRNIVRNTTLSHLAPKVMIQ